MLELFTSINATFKREWSINDVARLVRRHERFRMLSEADAVVLVQHMHPMRLEAGKVLFREGRSDESQNFMAIILDGEAKAETEGQGLGAPVQLGILKEGDLVGEQGIIHETPRSATVTARTDLMLASIDSARFDKLVKAKPALGCTILISMLRTVTTRLWEANQRTHVLEDSNRKLKKELDLEISSRPKAVFLDAKPLELTSSFFDPPPEPTEPPQKL
ncbi:cyclic nucleotide-binding domain-containing protein [Caenimonas sedimenti]|uniref:Cyclic nucleotide-binding domain-containing protein n=1 Tax=Caenimonas sedimenti TaxID=2596921 RepID=A0A562ZG96_9BURK|nr:cyclic nucleotide-binding domain-containing protein [Caenimonas sedimenti]TWO66620.1 cyclic nucleotide-binding domain-containing protein [Caenimonas sedimenti]